MMCYRGQNVVSYEKNFFTYVYVCLKNVCFEPFSKSCSPLINISVLFLNYIYTFCILNKKIFLAIP